MHQIDILQLVVIPDLKNAWDDVAELEATSAVELFVIRLSSIDQHDSFIFFAMDEIDIASLLNPR